MKNLDATKKRKRERAASKEGKLRRAAAKIQKLNKVHQQDMEDQKKGLVYQAGIPINDAKKKAKAKMKQSSRNPHLAQRLVTIVASSITLCIALLSATNPQHIRVASWQTKASKSERKLKRKSSGCLSQNIWKMQNKHVSTN